MARPSTPASPSRRCHRGGRPRLDARIGFGAAQCVLVSAPAGWGKTLLASSWLAAGAPPGATAWISLGPADDDLRTSVAAALLPAIGERAAGLLRTAVDGDDLEHAPGQVAAALTADAAPVVLVLDNLHEITSPTVHDSLLRLVQRPTPALRIIVNTRRDPPWPLHRLRLAGLLTEIRASDLTFREDETRALLDASASSSTPLGRSQR